MYTSSEAAMDANEYISFGRAALEIRKHGMECRPVAIEKHAHRPEIMIWDGYERVDGAAVWHTMPCTTRAILEHLGY